MVALIESVEPQRIGRACRPQPQRVDVAAAPAHHRRVIGNGLHRLGRLPDMAGDVVLARNLLHRSAEAYVVQHFRPFEFPWIAVGEPGFGEFLLPAILDRLAEQPVIVADAVAIGRHRQGCQALHVAGREPAEAAIAEGCVRLDHPEPVEVDAKLLQRRPHRAGQTEIVQAVEQQPPDQEFERQVIDVLAPVGVAGARGRHPAIDDAVAHRQRGGDEPVPLGCDDRVLAHGIGQLRHDRTAHRDDVLVLHRQGDARHRAAAGGISVAHRRGVSGMDQILGGTVHFASPTGSRASSAE